MKPNLALRRILAFAIDYTVIAAYIGVLLYVNLQVLHIEPVSPDSLASKVFGHLLALASLSLPVLLYFTLLESSPSAATLGKRVLGLVVVREDGQKAPVSMIALRNAVRLLPWEIAHIAIWYVPGRPFVDPMPIANLAVSVFANVAALLYISMLFVGDGRTLYDRFSGSQVRLKSANTHSAGKRDS